MLSQKINIFDFLQSKAQSMQNQNYLNSAGQLIHHQQQQQQQQQNSLGHQQQVSSMQHHMNQTQVAQNYSDEFKKTYSTFSPLIHQDPVSSYSQLNNCSSEMFRNYKQNERAVQQFNTGESSLESLKETQLRILESCNLVNESG